MQQMEKNRVIPTSIMIAKHIHGKESRRILRVLFDSGASHTMINRSCLPLNTQDDPTDRRKPLATIAGSYQPSGRVRLHNIVLPEFDNSRTIRGNTAYVFDAQCAYDVIMGRDLLSQIGLVMDFHNGLMHWMTRTAPMKSEGINFHDEQDVSYYMSLFDEDDNDDPDDPHDAFILEAKYERTNAREVAEHQKHLNEQQKRSLEETLRPFDVLFDGKLGHYTKRQVKLELDPNAVPFHSKAYSVNPQEEDVFKKELNHLVDIGVLRRCGPTEWASPTFIKPKKDGRVRWLSDFRYVNKSLKRKQYPLPTIESILRKRTGYKYFTKIDLTMFYYTLEIDEDSRELTTIVTPYGKYQYCRMAMGLKPAPDVAQSVIEEILEGLDVDAYIDDIGIFSNDWDEHMAKISQVLHRLQENGCKVNPLKCEWAVQETDFLGHWLTPNGLKPWKKKIDAIMQMDRPRNINQLRSFLGAVTYYRNMWPRRSHVLAPLTALTGKSTFEWTDACQRAFDEMKALISSDALMQYPNHNRPFHVYTDASDYQMGAAIIQDGRPVAYYSRKLNDAQKHYTTMEKELLAIVMCFKEFHSMLYGADITVYTDHRNLTFRTLNVQRVLRWRVFLEQYSPKFTYIEGKNNVLADCFSRLPRMDKPSEGKSIAPNRGTLIAFESLNIPHDDIDDEIFHFEDTITDYIPPPTEKELHRLMPCRFSCCRNDFSLTEGEGLECFLNYPSIDEMQNPITIRNIQEHQFEDVQLNESKQRNPDVFPVKYVQQRPIIFYKLHPDDDELDWKIALPTTLLESTVKWYHLILGHCGATRLYDTIRSRFYAPKLKRICDDYKCDDCQRFKQLGPGYGHLPARIAPLLPWNEVSVDMIGPWTVPVGNDKYEVRALTCIDPVTNLVELIRVENMTSKHIARQFENCWLARYPRPNKCIHDRGPEFVGQDFQFMLQQHGIIDTPITVRNPQANSVCERMHQTVGNILRIFTRITPAATFGQAARIVDDALATCMHAMRCAHSRALGESPGSLVFRRDMLMDLPILADLQAIQNKRQQLIDYNAQRQNQKRIDYDYKVGDEVLVKNDDPGKLEPRAYGPYLVTQVHTNGTIVIRRNDQVLERLNIRRVIPYKRQ